MIYEGIDPVTGRERRSRHPAGVDRTDAERLAARLASDRAGVNDEVRSLSFGAYLTGRWLPGKQVVLAATSYNGYRRNVENHIVPALGRIGLRRLRPHHLEALYDKLLHPSDSGTALAPKTVYEIHLVIRGALADAARRGLVTRNVALVAHAPRLRSIPKVEQKSWTAEQLPAFLRAAAGHRLFAPLWVSAFTGMRRNDLLGPAGTTSTRRRQPSRSTAGSSPPRTELHETRGKTPTARRRIDLDPTTVSILSAWREWQQTEQRAAGVDSAGWVFTDGRGEPVQPHAISQTFERVARRARVPMIRLHDLRHTHGTLLIAGGVPVKVVSERLGHATPAFTIDTYQHAARHAGASRPSVRTARRARASTGSANVGEDSRESRRRRPEDG